MCFRDSTPCRKALEIYSAPTVKNIFSSFFFEDKLPMKCKAKALAALFWILFSRTDARQTGLEESFSLQSWGQVGLQASRIMSPLK